MAVAISVLEEDGITSGVASRVPEGDSGIMGAVVVLAPADAGVEGAVLVLVVWEVDGGTDPRDAVTSAMF